MTSRELTEKEDEDEVVDSDLWGFLSGTEWTALPCVLLWLGSIR